MKRYLALVLLATLLVGCLNQEERFAVIREASLDPELRPVVLEECRKITLYANLGFKSTASATMGVPIDRVPDVFCARLFSAIAKGRLTNDDMIALQRGEATDLMRILKGF